MSISNIEGATAGVIDTSAQNTSGYLLSRDQIEHEYGITRRWLELAAIRGGGPTYIKVGPRTVRYRREELERWLAKREVRSTSEYHVGENAPKATELNAGHASVDSSANPEKCPGANAIEKHLRDLKVGGGHD